MKDEERIARVEEAVLIVKNLPVSHDGRFGDYFRALEAERREREESREDFNFKLNALIDAQMRNESEITELKESSRELK